MFMALYGAAAIFGGLLTLFSLLGGGDAEDSSTDDVQDTVESELPFSGRSRVFSLRTVSLGALGFGAGGLLLGFTGLGDLAVLVAALVLGLLSGGLSWYLMNYLLKSQSTTMTNLDDLVGREALVLVPLGKTMKGKVQVNGIDGTLPLAALLVDWARTDSAPVGSRLVVTGFDSSNTTVLVAYNDDLIKGDNDGRN